jgi:hypothetical protein
MMLVNFYWLLTGKFQGRLNDWQLPTVSFDAHRSQQLLKPVGYLRGSAREPDIA